MRASRSCGPSPPRMRRASSVGGGVNGGDVVAVDDRDRNAEAARARVGAGAGRQRRGTRRRGKAVVLAQEQHRQRIDFRPVQALEKGAAINGAVAEEAGDDVLLAAKRQALRRTDRDQDARAHDAVGAEHADIEIGNVHRAALAPAGAGLASEELGHHRRGRGSLGQRMAMSPMIAGDEVASAEIGADPGGNRFLADREMDRAFDLACLERGLCCLLEGADAAHGVVVAKHPPGVDVGVACLGHQPSFPCFVVARPLSRNLPRANKEKCHAARGRRTSPGGRQHHQAR